MQTEWEQMLATQRRMHDMERKVARAQRRAGEVAMWMNVGLGIGLSAEAGVMYAGLNPDPGVLPLALAHRDRMWALAETAFAHAARGGG